MKNTNILIIIAAVVVSLGAGFFGGMQYQKSQRTAGFTNLPRANQNGNFSGTRNGTGRPGGNAGFNRPVSGEITAISDKTLTVKLPDGSSRLVIYSGTTKINKTLEGTIKDLSTGTQISVQGTSGSDGTLTAQNIFVGGNFFGGRMNQPTPTP